MLGGPAPVRRFLLHVMEFVLQRTINPGKVFNFQPPLANVARLAVGLGAREWPRGIFQWIRDQCLGRRKALGYIDDQLLECLLIHDPLPSICDRMHTLSTRRR
jgi:hypothetical protein